MRTLILQQVTAVSEAPSELKVWCRAGPEKVEPGDKLRVVINWRTDKPLPSDGLLIVKYWFKVYSWFRKRAPRVRGKVAKTVFLGEKVHRVRKGLIRWFVIDELEVPDVGMPEADWYIAEIVAEVTLRF